MTSVANLSNGSMDFSIMTGFYQRQCSGGAMLFMSRAIEIWTRTLQMQQLDNNKFGLQLSFGLHLYDMLSLCFDK